nr:ABC transporter ATP-binding protein [Anaerolineae bacterium]
MRSISDNDQGNGRSSLRRSARTVLAGTARVLRLIWECHPGLTLALAVTTLLQSLTPAATSYAGKLIVDGVVQAIADSALDLYSVLPAVALALSLALMGTLLSRGSQLAQELLRDLLSNRINEMIINHAITLDLSFYENPHFYDMLQRAQREAGFRPLTLLTQILTIVSSTITALSLLALLLRFNPWIVLVLVTTTLPVLFVQARYGQEAFRLLNWRAPEARKLAYYAQLLTSEWSVKEIKLFNLARLLFGRYRALFARFYRENRGLTVRRHLAGAALALLSLLGYYGCYVYVIGRAVAGAITLGDLTLYGSVFLQLQGSLTNLLNGLSTIYESALFIGNLFAFLELRPMISPSANGRQPPEKWQEGFVFHNVSFCYPGTTRYVLRNVDLHIRPGEKIALVGENGAGKTTLVKLLTRLYDPTEGHITLDGVDLREYDLGSLRQCIGVIFQDFMRYYLPARENIGFGQVEALDDRERIVAAAQKSGAHAVISALPGGYDTVLGRWFGDGHQLSIGEWQKVALARAFMRDAPLLILDEPTASLDARTEYEVFRQFNILTHDRAAVLISHRFSTVRMAERIVVLEQGQIVEEGSHEQLLEQGGIYATLFNMQAENYR